MVGSPKPPAAASPLAELAASLPAALLETSGATESSVAYDGGSEPTFEEKPGASGRLSEALDEATGSPRLCPAARGPLPARTANKRREIPVLPAPGTFGSFLAGGEHGEMVNRNPLRLAVRLTERIAPHVAAEGRRRRRSPSEGRRILLYIRTPLAERKLHRESYAQATVYGYQAGTWRQSAAMCVDPWFCASSNRRGEVRVCRRSSRRGHGRSKYGMPRSTSKGI